MATSGEFQVGRELASKYNFETLIFAAMHKARNMGEGTRLDALGQAFSKLYHEFNLRVSLPKGMLKQEFERRNPAAKEESVLAESNPTRF